MMFALSPMPDYSRLSPEVMADVVAKIEYFQFLKTVSNKNIVVFADNENTSKNFWTSRMAVSTIPSTHWYLSNYPPIPTPPFFNEEQYRTYESDLMTFIDEYTQQKNYVSMGRQVFNIGTNESPRMHLILMNGDAHIYDGSGSDPPSDTSSSEESSENGKGGNGIMSDSDSCAGGSEGSGTAISSHSSSLGKISDHSEFEEKLMEDFSSRRRESGSLKSSSPSEPDLGSPADGNGENDGEVAGQQLARCENLVDIEELPRDESSPTPPDS